MDFVLEIHVEEICNDPVCCIIPQVTISVSNWWHSRKSREHLPQPAFNGRRVTRYYRQSSGIVVVVMGQEVAEDNNNRI